MVLECSQGQGVKGESRKSLSSTFEDNQCLYWNKSSENFVEKLVKQIGETSDEFVNSDQNNTHGCWKTLRGKIGKPQVPLNRTTNKCRLWKDWKNPKLGLRQVPIPH